MPRIFRSLALAALFVGAFVVPAMAATDFWATNVPVAYTEGIVDTLSHRLTKAYTHNLTNGGEVCAGAYKYAGLACHPGQVEHPFEGTHTLNAEALSLTGGTIRVNAHADY